MSIERETTRRRVLREGKVVFGNFAIVYDCVVRDMSDTGAKVQIESVSAVPDEFYLYLPTQRTMYKSAVRWRKAGQLGVHFDGEPVEVTQSSDPRFARFRMM